MNDFNEHNYLCHYGIKGMKWGIRRYQNPDGSLTSAGRARYGSVKNVKAHVGEQIKQSKFNANQAMVDQRRLDRSLKRTEKTKNKFLKTGKYKHLANYKAAVKSEKASRAALKNSKETIEKDYKRLLKEYGKENVTNIRYENGKIKEKTFDTAKVSSRYASAWTGQFILGFLGSIALTSLNAVLNEKRYGSSLTTKEEAKKNEKEAYKTYKKEFKSDNPNGVIDAYQRKKYVK